MRRIKRPRLRFRGHHAELAYGYAITEVPVVPGTSYLIQPLLFHAQRGCGETIPNFAASFRFAASPRRPDLLPSIFRSTRTCPRAGGRPWTDCSSRGLLMACKTSLVSMSASTPNVAWTSPRCFVSLRFDLHRRLPGSCFVIQPAFDQELRQRSIDPGRPAGGRHQRTGV